MNESFWGNRYVHSLLLGLFGVAVVLSYREQLGTVPVFAIAAGPIFAWTLGRLHERALVVASGLADEDDLREARREAAAENSLFGLLTRRGD